MPSNSVLPAGNPATLVLTGNQDVRRATELHATLHELLLHDQCVTIDCSNVEAIDASFVQLILAARKESLGRLHLIPPSDPEVLAWFRYSGLESQLMN